MSSSFGNSLRLTLFGESHGAAVGMVLDGLPAGLALDMAALARDMARRAPGGAYATARREGDVPRFTAGLFEGRTNGAPLCALIENEGAHSADYDALRGLARPGHADLPAHIRHHGFNDPRGGGHYSGRLTAPLMLAGGVARQLLARAGAEVAAHLASVGGARDRAFTPGDLTPDALRALRQKERPVLEDAAWPAMAREVEAARAAGDSVGGTVTCAAAGLPAGLGEPFFDGVESLLAHALFAIPAVKAVGFGEGFALSGMRGSEANDPFAPDGRARERNRNGGLSGGLTNGMPLVFTAAFRPTPTIAAPQRLARCAGGTRDMPVGGRHDPCVALRALPVAEAACALVLCDVMTMRMGCEGWMRYLT